MFCLSTLFSCKVANSLDTEFCLDALEMALANGRRPEISQPDQGCPLILCEFVPELQAETIRISWSG